MSDWSTFEGIVHMRTTKAVLFQGWYWGASLWLPMSQIEVVPDGPMSVVVKVKDWLAGKKDLREFETYTEEQIRQRNDS